MTLGLLKRVGILGVLVLGLTLAAVIWRTEAIGAAHRPGDLSAPVDAVIVLGQGVEGDGRLAYGSRRRAMAGARLVREGRARYAIMSGGLGEYHPAMPAGSLMRRFAVAAGAPPERVLVEPRSVSTFENLRFSLRLAERRGLERLALASDAYHLARARALAAYFGHPDVGLVAARGFGREPWFVRAAHLLREAMAWWYNLLKVACWEALGALGVPEGARAEFVR